VHTRYSTRYHIGKVDVLPRAEEGIVTPGFMNGPAHYLQAGFVLISAANLIVILLMIAIFILAVVLPVPRRGGRS